jgi:hypothetical protein
VDALQTWPGCLRHLTTHHAQVVRLATAGVTGHHHVGIDQLLRIPGKGLAREWIIAVVVMVAEGQLHAVMGCGEQLRLLFTL